MAKTQRSNKNGAPADHVAYYHTYKYNSLQRLNKTKNMHGVKRVIAFCILTAVLPASLIILPLYLRHTVFADVVYPIAESDIIEIRDGISTVFCQRHTLQMNTSFNAFQLNQKPEISQNRKHIRLKKSMSLPDDTLEYWGFYLLKGATVALKVCSRYDGSRILVVKGERNLRTCGLLDHNKNKVGAHYNTEHIQVKVTFESAAEIVESSGITSNKSGRYVSPDEGNHGRKWFGAFMRRNPGFSLRTPETVSSASARVSEGDIRGWFRSIRGWLEKHDMLEILDCPERVFNGDETSFYLHSKSKEVLARTGSRNVYEVEQAPGKQNVTVMFAFSAAGCIVPPHVILPGKRLRKEVIAGFPDAWGIGQSERGWMDVNNFRSYIQNILHPFLVQQNVVFPVIFFVDGHASHKSLEVADLCLSLGIVLISLYPNTTHITQPADVAVFKPLKDEWRRGVEQWRSDHHGEILTLVHFGKVLAQTVAQGIKPASIKNGFRVCGLCPFEPDNVDYSKCIARTCNAPEESEASNHEIDPPAELAPSPLSPQHDSFTTVDLQSSTLNTRDNTAVSLQTTDECVSVHINKIIQAVDMIGPQTMSRIQGNVGLLSRDERTIRFFYQEFVRPYISVTNCDTVDGEDINRLQIASDILVPDMVTDPAAIDDSILMCSIAATSNDEEESVAFDNMNLPHEIPPIVIEVPADTWNQSLNSSQMETEDIIYCQLNNESPTNNSTQNAGNDHAIRNNEGGEDLTEEDMTVAESVDPSGRTNPPVNPTKHSKHVSESRNSLDSRQQKADTNSTRDSGSEHAVNSPTTRKHTQTSSTPEAPNTLQASKETVNNHKHNHNYKDSKVDDSEPSEDQQRHRRRRHHGKHGHHDKVDKHKAYLQESLSGVDMAMDNIGTRARRDIVYDRKINHGGNAMNFSNNNSDSESSFENSLLTCYDGDILVAQSFPPSHLCKDVQYLENGIHMVTKHEVASDGYYYYIFYSDNDYVQNDIHAVFDIYKPTFQYSNISESKGCVNSTNCSFPISFWSDERVIVEVPTRDGIEHEEDDITFLISTCQPRMAVYIVFPISVLFLVLTCAFL